MWNTLIGNSKTSDAANDRNHEFLYNLTRVEAAFGFGYSFILLSLGAIFTGLVFLAITLICFPAIILLNKHKFEVSARLLLISCGLIYIYSANIGIKFDLGAEFYYLPLMMLSLLVFDVRQKKEVIVGMGLPLIAWIIGRWGTRPELPAAWMPIDFPDELFRTISFLGSFFLTAIF
ncbi:MAG: hypothetical protein EHM20_10840, partial [Alphaproteobacteria bacterium]